MNYTHLSQSERYQIQCLRDMGLSITQTALRLGRHNTLIEVRNDLIGTSAEQAHWAARLAPILSEVLAGFAGPGSA